jgi:hypothetical protein
MVAAKAEPAAKFDIPASIASQPRIFSREVRGFIPASPALAA